MRCPLLRLLTLTGVSLTSPELALAQTPDSIERCRVIAQEMTDYKDDTVLLFERFCEALHVHAAPPAVAQTQPPAISDSDPIEIETAAGYFVKCVVENDPQWIGFRLVTRDQCEEMQGSELGR